MRLGPSAPGIMRAPTSFGVTSDGVLSSAVLRRWKFHHQEMLGSITSTGVAFQIALQLYAHPADTHFLWLSRIAPLWEKYAFHSLALEFRTTSATASAGAVMLFFDTDAADPAPGNKVELMTNAHSLSAPIWSPRVILKVPGSNSGDSELDIGRLRYTDSRGADGFSSRVNSAGQCFVALEGVAAGVVGDVYIHYDIELVTPQNGPTLDGVEFNADNPDPSHPFGSDQGVPLMLQDALSAINGGSLTVCPGGAVEVIGQYVGTVITDTPPNWGRSSTLLQYVPFDATVKHNTAGTIGDFSFLLRNMSTAPQYISFDFTPNCGTFTSAKWLFMRPQVPDYPLVDSANFQ